MTAGSTTRTTRGFIRTTIRGFCPRTIRGFLVMRDQLETWKNVPGLQIKTRGNIQILGRFNTWLGYGFKILNRPKFSFKSNAFGMKIHVQYVFILTVNTFNIEILGQLHFSDEAFPFRV